MKTNKPIEEIGVFWIDDQPHTEVHGFFTFDSVKGGHLRLDIAPRVLTGLSTWHSGDRINGITISGRINKGIQGKEYIQLRGCTLHLGLTAPVHVGFSHMLVSQQAFHSGVNQLRFTGMRARFVDQSIWAGPPSADDKEERETLGFFAASDKLVCQHHQPRITVFRLESDGFRIGMPVQRSRDSMFDLEYESSVSVEQLIDAVFNLQYLLSLCMDKATEPTDVYFTRGTEEVQLHATYLRNSDSSSEVRYPLFLRLDDIGIDGVWGWLRVASQYPKTVRHIWKFMYDSKPGVTLPEYLVDVQRAAEALATKKPIDGSKPERVYFEAALKRIYNATSSVHENNMAQDWDELVNEANAARNAVAHIHEWEDEPHLLYSQAGIESIHALTLVYLFQMCGFDTNVLKEFYAGYTDRRVSPFRDGSGLKVSMAPVDENTP